MLSITLQLGVGDMYAMGTDWVSLIDVGGTKETIVGSAMTTSDGIVPIIGKVSIYIQCEKYNACTLYVEHVVDDLGTHWDL